MNEMTSPQATRIVNVMLVIMVIVMIASVASFGVMYKVSENQKSALQLFHQESAANLKNIEANQVKQTVASKDYIACLLTLQQGTTLQAQEQTCFDKAPEVK